MASILSSDAAIQMMVGFEISDAATYAKLYQAPTWPGGASGVTVGVGYDCGYHSAAEIVADWAPLLDAAAVAALRRVAGLKAGQAHVACSTMGHVRVPYEAADRVFSKTDIPRTEAQVLAAFPRSVELSADSFGALTSLVFNRGADCSNTPTRKEMHEIQAAIAAGDFAAVPDLIRAMKRLWEGLPSMQGLLDRRDAEAALFERGLDASTPAASPSTPVAQASTPAASPSTVPSPDTDPADALDDLYNPGA
jgi:GH24 family phage-related lysozyme (muramidase)